MNLQKITQAERAKLASIGIVCDSAQHYMDPKSAEDQAAFLAMDAQPGLITASNSGIPSFLSTFIDPNVIKVLVTPNKAASILGEAKKGDWTMSVAMFPIVEHTGEVTSYGDVNEGGSTGANVNYPQRQSYHYQTISQWGERQIEMYGLGKIDYVSKINISSAMVLDKFQNNTYFYGVAGLQNYGLLNDPSLSAPIAPGAKAASGNQSGPWTTNGFPTATANEIYTDIQALYIELVAQSGGLIEMDAKMKLVMSPTSSVALTVTNQFKVNVFALLKENFPNITFETAVQYATTGGQLVQLIAEEVDGQETGYCAFTEKMRAHRIVPGLSDFKQKKTQGSWGAIIRQPVAIAQMIGV